ncbi:MAG: cation:proton antiporter [Spirochaetales bacterium]|nr:MAG: cation:proton antiporter [Spirochaetales bacterium]
MKTHSLWALVRFIITTLVLFGVWILFTGNMQLYPLLAGLAGSMLVSLLTYRVFLAEHEASLKFFVPSPFYLLIFIFYLIYSLYASSLKMARSVITGRAIPRIVHFRTRLRSDVARMVLCNSITFTPGTITLDLNEDHLTVYWFFAHTRHAKAAGEAVKGRFEKLLSKVWI